MRRKPMLPDDSFADKVMIVTGGGTGLGRRIAETAARLGARVVLASRDPAHLEAARGAIVAAGGEALAVTADVRDHRQVRTLVRATVERLGRLDLLVNNAAGNFIRPAEKLPEAAFRNIVDIVLNGTFYCSRAAARAMIERGAGGAILNVLATYAWTGGPGTVHSACAKAGVLAMTRTLAVEWAQHGIRVNGIAPGPLDTEGASARLWPTDEMEDQVRRSVPLGRFATLDEIVDASLYLLSDYASYATGEVLTLDGGAWLGRGVLGASGESGVPVIRRRRHSRRV